MTEKNELENKKRGRGKPRIINSPEELYSFFEMYVAETKGNPTKVQDYVGKDGTMVYRERERPLILDGFFVFMAKLRGDISNYIYQDLPNFENYIEIVARIRREIRVDQINGGMTGIYPQQITARLNNIHDTIKQETTLHQNFKILNIDPIEAEIRSIDAKEVKQIEDRESDKDHESDKDK